MLDGKTMNTQCSIYYLHKYIDKLIEDGSRIICIFANNVKSNKPLDSMVKRKTNTIIQDIIIIIDNIKVTRQMKICLIE